MLQKKNYSKLVNKSISAHRRLKEHYWNSGNNKQNNIKYLYHVNCIYALQDKRKLLSKKEKENIYKMAVNYYH